LCDALGACAERSPVYRRLLKMALEELRLIDEQIGQLDKEMLSLEIVGPQYYRDKCQPQEECYGDLPVN
jgi:hypothetical protein